MNLNKKYLTEFTGVFFLAFTSVYSANAVVIAAVISVLIYAGRPLSGAHYNPVVSLVLRLLGKISNVELLFYLLSQFAGASAVVLFAYSFGGNISVLKPSPDVNNLIAVVYEALFTFLLVFTILMVCISGYTEGNQYFAIAIGFAVLVGISVAGPVSGGSMNPAVAMAMILSDLLKGGKTLNYIWIYFAGPLSGGLIALYLYKYLNRKINE